MTVDGRGWKTVCGWCGSHVSGDPLAKLVSHGICPVCMDEAMREVGAKDEPGRIEGPFDAEGRE